jgi:peptidoglycan/xylan/chitin deacetylase (PgdA/CDA1 family)
MRSVLRNIFLKVAGTIKYAEAGVHIINSHFVTPHLVDLKRDAQIFDDFLNYLQSFSSFITLEEATNIILSNFIPTNKVLVAFTFDDGFEECHSVIAPLLEKYNTRGAFFINANYIESDKNYQLDFNKRINTYTKSPMKWSQVVDLHNKGHLIGSHTLDHVNMTDLNEKELDFQLKKNKQILEEKLDFNCEYFAWTYGQLQHFPINALKATQKYHKYIYSGTNYKKYFSYDGQVLNRRHIEAYWPKSHVKYFLSTNKKL